jgi:hypothetical protein
MKVSNFNIYSFTFNKYRIAPFGRLKERKPVNLTEIAKYKNLSPFLLKKGEKVENNCNMKGP